MAGALRASGWDVRVFSGNRVEGAPVEHISAARAFLQQDRALAIYHGGAGWNEGFEMVRATAHAIVLRDHNITPPSFFDDVSEEFVAASRRGEEQRRALLRDRRMVRALPASPRNADDLRRAGAEPSLLRVVPPFHQAERLVACEPDRDALRAWQIRPAVSFVGRVAPNKGHLRLLAVARAYRELYRAPLPLRLVGSADPRHDAWLRRVQAAQSTLPEPGWVEWTGPLDPTELAAAYLTTTVFLSCSEHEGFCVPLVEAASFGVPLLALREPGVAETVGEGGLLLSPDEGPDVIAAALHRILTDDPLREQLAAAARTHVAERFSTAKIADALEAALAGV